VEGEGSVYRVAPMPDGLPLRLRVQFTITRVVTRVLRLLGLRAAAIRLRYALGRGKRRMFETFGSARYSRPALYEMDRKLNAVIDKDGGFFVEAGGADGYTQSNSYYLERFRGWRGILVEPMRELAEEATRNRPGARLFRCALVPSDYDGDGVEMEFGDLFSSVNGIHGEGGEWAKGGLLLGWRDHRSERVPARTLTSLLDEAAAPNVDLLSLDVEGYEPEVLRGLDLDRHAPTWILVEMHDLDEGRAGVEAVLGERYSEHSLLSPLDVLYRRRD
jgi:FkbM family methyltransferase